MERLTLLTIFLSARAVNADTALCQDHPLGMEDGTILDSQITASSEFSANHGASNARLNQLAGDGSFGAWLALTNDANQWIQVDLGAPRLVTGVVTQGRPTYDQWVTKYKVQYSDNGESWQYVNDVNRQEGMVFNGNSDRNTAVINFFPFPIQATFIRIQPTEWRQHISMRFEVLGCEACLAGQIQGPSNVIAKYGDVATLACTKTNEDCTVLWNAVPDIGTYQTLFISEFRVTSDPKYDNFQVIMSEDSNQRDLRITDAKVQDEGTYSCGLYETSKRKGATLLIEVETTSLQMTQAGMVVSTVEAIEGLTADITCVAQGARPAVDILWFQRRNTYVAEERILTGIVQTNISTDGNKTFDTISTLHYVFDKHYNGRPLKCTTSNQEVALPKETTATLDVKYAPVVKVQYKVFLGDTMVICSSVANPMVADNDYLIIVNQTDEYRPSCSNGICTLHLDVSGATHVSCSATNSYGTGSDSIIVLPDEIHTTLKYTPGTPIVAVAIPLAVIAAASIAVAVTAILQIRRLSVYPDSTENKGDFKEPSSEPGSEVPTSIVSYTTNTELDANTRKVEAGAQSQLQDAESPTYEEIPASYKDQMNQGFAS